jgi:hypothetical protein
VAPQLVPVAWQVPNTQQPPLAHSFPAQQGAPAAPQAAQLLVAEQVLPPDEQKLGYGLGVWQQPWPVAPHVPPWHEPVLHVPRFVPHEAPPATQVRSKPQQSPPLHSPFWQQGWPVMPHATHAPPEHIMPRPQLVPEVTQAVPTQQPPP